MGLSVNGSGSRVDLREGREEDLWEGRADTAAAEQEPDDGIAEACVG